MTARWIPALMAVLAAQLALAGCGLGPGPAPRGVSLTVTRDFGARALLRIHAPRVRGQETVMSLLRRNARIATRYAGGFVQGIDGLTGGHQAGRAVDWFYYVNGVQADRGAAETVVHPGDRVWWDRHDWRLTDTVPAVVGSFPEPFLAGIAGRRLPVRVECSQPESRACHVVLERLRSSHVPAALAAFVGGDSTPHTLRVLVGPFAALAGDPAAHQLTLGPGSSGVYARFQPAGSSLAELDADGHLVRTLTRGGGLVAATRFEGAPPVWFVTGTDAAGVLGAARALREAALRDRFAIALTPAGAIQPLPTGGS